MRNFTLYDISKESYFEYQCINPGANFCEFGPCPNPDVTGIGQQVSSGSYISCRNSISFNLVQSILLLQSAVGAYPQSHLNGVVLTFSSAITIMHNPAELKIPAFSFLINLNSLLISCLISLFRGQLTHSDAVFIIVAAMSPASLYIWAISLRTILNRLPYRIVPGFPTKQEQLILIVCSFIPFILWAVLLGLLFSPSTPLKFSQADCGVPFYLGRWMKLLWAVLFVGGVIGSGFLIYLRSFLGSPKQSLPHHNGYE
jgi:hypothetical protein